ncbi:MAG: hypothetical protein RQ715_11460 [Methylococcales bacterium]|nr:hypothetical protein [Methylococcales bacterium]
MIRVLSLLLTVTLLSACDTPTAKQTEHLAPEGLFTAALSEHYALVAGTLGPARLWRITPKREIVHTWQHTEANDGIIKVAISGDERYAITAERHSFAWWRIADGQLLDVWSLPDIQSLALAHDGTFALIGLEDKAVYFALEYGRTIHAFTHDAAVTTVALSASGQFAITGSADTSAKLWRLTDGQLLHRFAHKNALMTVAISPDDRYVFSNAELGRARLWHLKSGKLKTTLGPEWLTLTSAAFAQDGLKLVTGQMAGRIELWQTSTGKALKLWRTKKSEQGRGVAGTPLALSLPPNKDIVSINGNGYLQRWRQ